MVTIHTKMSLIQARGARCEVCKCSRWKGHSIVTALVMARKDRNNLQYTDENAILVCRMCFYTQGYNKRNRRTKAEIETARFNATPTPEQAMHKFQGQH